MTDAHKNAIKALTQLVLNLAEDFKDFRRDTFVRFDVLEQNLSTKIDRNAQAIDRNAKAIQINTEYISQLNVVVENMYNRSEAESKHSERRFRRLEKTVFAQ